MMLTSSDHALLRRATLFAETPSSTVDRLLASAHAQSFAAGSVLFEQGGPSGFLHVLLSGRVGLIGRAEDGHETVVEFFGPGDIFIAPAVILELPYLMAARVLDEARVLMIPAEQVRAALASDAGLTRAMMRELARHWRLLVRQIKDLKLRRGPQRLAAHLLTLPRSRSGEIHLPEERRFLAQRLGMTPESLSRAFASLRRLGVSGRGRRVVVADPAKLEAYAAVDKIV
ncbi:MAG: cyclic nucleotide-binding domain-containing protein [Pseudomonadota bacterium]